MQRYKDTKKYLLTLSLRGMQTIKGDLFILAMSLASDKEKLLKEVTTMVFFDHPNVMSLIGVCFDGDMPLIIMPYMSNGSVLEYVKQKLLHDRDVNEEKVCNSMGYIIFTSISWRIFVDHFYSNCALLR